MTQNLKAALVALLPVLGAAVGCSGPGGGGVVQAPQQATLAEVADMLRAAGTNGRAPTKLADLNKLQAMYPKGYDAIKSGEVVVLWGAGDKVQGEGAIAKGGGDVVAYEKDAPSNGGYVLLSSGEIKQMTAAEFAAAPKAAKK